MNPNAEFDVIVYGATGFTGRLVAEYLTKEYGVGGEVKWAMAGRSADKLESVRDEIGAPADTPLIVADANDPASLKDMVARAKCICTTVGPYQLYGETLLSACVDAGTDYVDLCGEPNWMADMIAAYDVKAKASGARVVFSCGFDSIPFDLGVFFLQSEAKKKFGKPLPRVKGRVRRMQGTFSGGTAASFAASMVAMQKDPELFKRQINPFALTGGFNGPQQPPTHKVKHDDELGVWVAPFIMESINSKNVHRSNALMAHAYGEDFTYNEMMVTGPGDKGKAMADAIAGGNMMGGKDVPKPGEGPSKEEREAGFYDVLVVGYDAEGEKLRAGVTGDKDPGYGSTSKMIAEAAICLVNEAKEASGGVLTTAPVMGMPLIERLRAKAGLTFNLES